MFGYVVVNKPELKIREFQEYRSYYCGLCRALRGRCGVRGQLSLSYDMTFLAMLLTFLYEPLQEEDITRCIVHPLGKQKIKRNEMIDYVADMNLLLTWYKCRDDYADEGKFSRALYSRSIQQGVRQIEHVYERQAKAIEQNMQCLSQQEKEGTEDIDDLSACFGRLLAEVFVVKQDEWENYLRKIGFYIGRFVYIIDAYDDLQSDKKKGCFNPFARRGEEPDFDQWVKELLLMCAAEFAREFEKLPILENAEILRNILYSGIWTRYEEVKKKRMEDVEAENEKSI